jgi:TonB-linked SusC/RagA family outer membrane protein
MKRPWLTKVLFLPGAMLFLLAGARVTAAQNVTFSGRVTTSDGQPLAGASVGVTEMGAGAITSEQGRYSFYIASSLVNGKTVNVVARHIGYKPKRMPITVSGGVVEKDFALDRDVLQLEEVVVTGTSGATSQLKTPFTVNVVDNQQIKEVPSSSPVGALEGKVAGAEVITTNGEPGSAPAIRLRSATSLTGRQDPLIILDGTLTRLSMADINSEDIDHVEVIKGAAASSLYGSDAANGVIQIFTKRGANLGEGQTAASVRTEYGASTLPNIVPGNLHHPYKMLDPNNPSAGFDESSGSRTSDDDLIADNPYPVYYDQYSKVFRPGQKMTNYASIGRRQGQTNYNISFENEHDQGVLRLLDGYRRQNFRVNVDQALTDKWDMGAGAFYGRSTADQTDGWNFFFGMRFIEPNVKIDSIITACPPGTTCSYVGHYNPAIRQAPLSGNVHNPLYDLQTLQRNNDRDRFTGTWRTAYRFYNWLTADANVGYDEANRAYKSVNPFGFTVSTGNSTAGSLEQRSDNNRSYNANVSLTSVRDLASWLHNTTKLAALYEDQTNQFTDVTADRLTVPQVPEFGAADQSGAIRPGSSTEIIRARDVFAVSTFEIKDRYFVDGLIRRDQSSLFGADERAQTYHRLSAAYRASQDVHLPGVDELKLRVSHGTAGLRPPFSAQYEVFDIGGGSPHKLTLGNSKLRPAFSRETEYGVNLSALKNYSFEYTYSAKRTTDEIIQVPLPAATGYSNQWQNAGTLSGHTHELALGAVLASARDYFWRLNITADRTRQTIEDLKVPPFLVGPDGTTQMFRIGPGQPFGIIYGEKWIRTAQQLQQTIALGQLSGTAADYQLNEDGFYVRKTDYHTINEVPLKAWICEKPGTSSCTSMTTNQVIGDVNPDFHMGFNTTATFKGLALNATLTWTKGGNIYNMTRQWPFNELRDTVFDQSKKPAISAPCAANWQTAAPTCPYATGRKPTSYYSTFYDAITPNDYFVENGTFMRLRELALNYTVPKTVVDKLRMRSIHSMRIGLVGRNLWTTTKYSGYDPDVSGFGGDPFSYRVDYFSYPSYRTWTGMVELGW